MVGGITPDRGRGRNRCVDEGLPVAFHPLRERDAAYKQDWLGEWASGWVVIHWVGGVAVWM